MRDAASVSSWGVGSCPQLQPTRARYASPALASPMHTGIMQHCMSPTSWTCCRTGLRTCRRQSWCVRVGRRSHTQSQLAMQSDKQHANSSSHARLAQAAASASGAPAAAPGSAPTLHAYVFALLVRRCAPLHNCNCTSSPLTNAQLQADLNGDGHLEVIIATHDFQLQVRWCLCVCASVCLQSVQLSVTHATEECMSPCPLHTALSVRSWSMADHHCVNFPHMRTCVYVMSAAHTACSPRARWSCWRGFCAG